MISRKCLYFIFKAQLFLNDSSFFLVPFWGLFLSGDPSCSRPCARSRVGLVVCCFWAGPAHTQGPCWTRSRDPRALLGLPTLRTHALGPCFGPPRPHPTRPTRALAPLARHRRARVVPSYPPCIAQPSAHAVDVRKCPRDRVTGLDTF